MSWVVFQPFGLEEKALGAVALIALPGIPNLGLGHVCVRCKGWCVPVVSNSCCTVPVLGNITDIYPREAANVEFQSILSKIVLYCTLFDLFIAIYCNKFTYCPTEYGQPRKQKGVPGS